MSQESSRVPVLLGVVLVLLCGVLSQRITPTVLIPASLRLDIVVLGACGAATLLSPTTFTSLPLWPTWLQPGSKTGVFQRERPVGVWAKARAWIRLALAGALVGAALVAPWVAVPWLVAAALAFAWAWRGRGRGVRRRVLALLVVVLAAGVNLLAVSAAMARGLRVAPEEFAALDLRVNTLLADVPIHDAWSVELPGDGPATLENAGAILRRFSPFQTTPAMLALGILREVLGDALGWEDPRWSAPETSWVQRLNDADRERSTTAPGTMQGRWRVLYAFGEEGAIETINGTVHLAVACAIRDGAFGSRLYLVFRVNEVNWSTPYYMRLIDPFRRLVVYPPNLRQFAHIWEAEGRASASEASVGSGTW